MDALIQQVLTMDIIMVVLLMHQHGVRMEKLDRDKNGRLVQNIIFQRKIAAFVVKVVKVMSIMDHS